MPGGLTYGHSYVVEFEPHSLWYETSLTIAAHALKHGIRTEYHTFMHVPNEVREALAGLGLNVKKLEQEDALRILDTYDVTTGLSVPEKPVKGEPYESQSFNVLDWSSRVVSMIKEGFSQPEKEWLHLDDNTSVLNQYSEEKVIIDAWRTRFVPYARARELAMVHSLLTGVASEAFYKQFESLCDGIIDFKSQEERGRIEHYARVRTMRAKICDSRWRHLRLLDNGGVALDAGPVKDSELGIRRWLKGPKK